MVNSASKFDHHAAWRRPSLAQERAAHAGHADLHRRELRPGRSVLRSIILPEHAGIISDAVRARAGVLPSKLLQLSFRALLKMDTVFADRWASEPSVARRATGPELVHPQESPSSRERRQMGVSLFALPF